MLLRYSTILIILLAFAAGVPAAVKAADNTAKLDAGIVEGVVSGDVLSFKGIPYAAPPVGDLRWREPQPVKPWSGVRKAAEYGNDCMQQPIPGDAAASGSAFSEDCLVLNVWRPAAGESRQKRPVMVWIYGGGYLNGGSSAAIFDGSAFAREGLVLVSFNYRLGRLGFFAHPALTAAKEGPLANYGLMDQLAALRWIRKNIGAFGGDPDQVTIVGESAGGISVIHMMTWPEARGLFHRAAVLSGGGRTYLTNLRKLSESTPELPSAEQSGVEFAKNAGITGTDAAALAALRGLPAEKVNGDLSIVALITKPPTYAGGPVRDGEILTGNPQDVFLRGEAAGVPVIIGTTSQDLPVSKPQSSEDPLSHFGSDAKKAADVYNPDGKLSAAELVAAIGVDMTMHEPARFVAKQMTKSGMPVWLYRFSYVADSLRPKQKGAEHSSELPYMFQTLDARYGKDVTEKDRAMSGALHEYIANFAKSGDPNGPDLPKWPKYDPAKADLLNFTLNRGIVIEADPLKDRLDLVEKVADAQQKQDVNQSTPTDDLGGTSWQFVRFQGVNLTILTPDDPSKYTITFDKDGEVNVRFDCNRGRGTWKSAGPHELQLGILALTRAMCPPWSLHDHFVKNWQSIRSYVQKNGHLFLFLMADAGVFEFEPISGSGRQD